jgi:sugar lactone lactonase YvrE
MKTLRIRSAFALITLMLPFMAAHAGGHTFPKLVQALTGAPPEGFAIGRAYTAYNGSVDGSIYKMDLRSGEGELLVPAEPDFDLFSELNWCYKLGMRVDRRSNYLFVAGCQIGNAYVFDAETGEELMQYQLTPEYSTVINDLAITRDAVYFTDFGQPFLHRLPLSRNGRLPAGTDASTALPLTGDFGDDHDAAGFSLGNGIVATPNGEILIVGNSANAQIYRVDPATGHSDRIVVDPPLEGFLDGIVMQDNLLFILTPYDPAPVDMIQVVELDEDMLTGTLLGVITDTDLDGVASGALFGDSLYVNNARYSTFPMADTEYWITKLSIYDVE